MTLPLPDPGEASPLPFAPTARRTLTVLGAPVELVLLPERAQRPGQPGTRPAFRADPVPRIVRTESVWSGNGLHLTPNRYPFARDQWILWPDAATREHGTDLLHALFAFAEARHGTAMVNSIGAAASIPRAHGHVTAERLPFLPALPEHDLRADWLPSITGVTWHQKDATWLLIGARGAPAARAAAITALQVTRCTAAFNLVDQDSTAWLYPRSSCEIPAPHFPWALGAAEVWGRWCYVDQGPWATATAEDLERALTQAGVPA